ncbi:MAG: hypothetical protein IPM34_05535 [Saprospiraceae bacterium]|nr:hypothetical protein [Saprospiraceae bacterium]
MPYPERILARALISTRFKDLEHFKTAVNIIYNHKSNPGENSASLPSVLLNYKSNGETIEVQLESGVTQGDLTQLQKSNKLQQFKFAWFHPAEVRQRKDLEKVHMLSRRRADVFGSKDVAFYDLAEASVSHIHTPELAYLSARDSSEKGFLNTFNHVTAQALITSFFSKDLADLIGDLHERYYMPELLTGQFNEKQLQDTINNPTDNYVDLINNEIGQRLGLQLKEKYKLSQTKKCTPALLASYLNDLQSYYMWALEIGMSPFKATDEKLIKFSNKMNRLLENE